jgi:hypothetical protein
MITADVLRLVHDPDAFDQSGEPPAINQVTVGGHDFSFQNKGYLEASTAFAVHDISSLKLTIHLELGHNVDSLANILTLALEQHAVVMHDCNQGEPMKVCCSAFPFTPATSAARGSWHTESMFGDCYISVRAVRSYSITVH